MSVLTISRQFGAGGKTVGKMVAEKLGYTFIDDEIITMVAEKARVSEKWVESIEKEAGGTLSKFLSTFVAKSFMDRLLDKEKGYIDEDVYIDALHDVIVRIAKDGNCVILGRGGQYILRGMKDCFHIQLIAERVDRVKFMEEKYNLLPSQAKNIVSIMEKRRLNLFRRFGQEDYDDPMLYDVVLNTSRITVETAARIVCNLLEIKC